MPVAPATREAEAGELLEPGDGDCSELRSRHCMTTWATVRDSVSKRKKPNGQVQWLMPVIPALWKAKAALGEAKAGESQGQEFETSLADMLDLFAQKTKALSALPICSPSNTGPLGAVYFNAQTSQPPLTLHFLAEVPTLLSRKAMPETPASAIPAASSSTSAGLLSYKEGLRVWWLSPARQRGAGHSSEIKHISRTHWLLPVIPSLWEAKVGKSRGQEFEISLANTVKPCPYYKYKKISQPGQQEPNSVSKKKREKRQEEKKRRRREKREEREKRRKATAITNGMNSHPQGTRLLQPLGLALGHTDTLARSCDASEDHPQEGNPGRASARSNTTYSCGKVSTTGVWTMSDTMRNQNGLHAKVLNWIRRGGYTCNPSTLGGRGRLTKPQAVTDWSLGKQDGSIRVSSDVILDLAKTNPAGIHSIQYMGRGDIRVGNPECNCIKRDLENEFASHSIHCYFERLLLISTTRLASYLKLGLPKCLPKIISKE
ncbi:hypothetical protein AAY473_025541 [Plecturocebus cupreus]